MKLEMIGINHRTSNVDARGRAAVNADTLPGVVERILHEQGIEGTVVLSTCNRTELYLSPTFHLTDAKLRSILGATFHLAEEETMRAYVRRDSDVALHLFRVASGLDSQILGEIQVLAQVKQAYQSALEHACTTGILNRVFLSAIECGKLVRHRTAISRGAVSVAFAAVEVAQRIFGKLNGQNILLIGAGETAQLAAKHMGEVEATTWRVSNRTLEHAEHLAEHLGGVATAYPPSTEDIAWADVVVCAASAQDTIVHSANADSVARERKRPLLFLDLAVPRNVDPALASFDNVYVYGVDDFTELVRANLRAREQEAVRAEKLIERQVEDFVQWYRENRIAPTIQQLQLVLESIRMTEVESNVHRFAEQDRDEVEKFSKAMMRKVCSLLVANMKRAAVDGNDLSLARAVTVAFSRGDQTAITEILEKLDHELSH